MPDAKTTFTRERCEAISAAIDKIKEARGTLTGDERGMRDLAAFALTLMDERDEMRRDWVKSIKKMHAARALDVEALRVAEQHCPCGARPESPDTHPHVTGCRIGERITAYDKEVGGE